MPRLQLFLGRLRRTNANEATWLAEDKHGRYIVHKYKYLHTNNILQYPPFVVFAVRLKCMAHSTPSKAPGYGVYTHEINWRLPAVSLNHTLHAWAGAWAVRTDCYLWSKQFHSGLACLLLHERLFFTIFRQAGLPCANEIWGSLP